MPRAKKVVDMRLKPAEMEFSGLGMRNERISMKLPEGCIGLLFVYESKRAAMRDGCKGPFMEIEFSEKKK